MMYKQNDHCFKTHYKYALVIFVNWTSSYICCDVGGCHKQMCTCVDGYMTFFLKPHMRRCKCSCH